MTIKKITSYSLYLLFLLIIAEAATRVFFFASGKDIEIYQNYSFTRQANMFGYDNLLYHRLIPNVTRNVTTSEYEIVYRINSIGIRDKEVSATPDKFRILFLGDSQTFGEGVEEHQRFSNLIEQGLEGTYVINAGVPGYGIHQMLPYFKYLGADLKPDLLVLTIMDISFERAAYGMLRTKKPNSAPPPPHLIRTPEEFKELQTRAFKGLYHSYLYSFARVRFKLLMLRRWIEKRDKMVWDKIYKEGEIGFHIRTAKQKRIVEEVGRKYLEDYAEFFDRKNFEVLVVNVGRKKLPWLERYLEQKNVAYLDLVQQLKRSPKFYFEIDSHFSKHGHREIADLLTRYFSENFNLRKSTVH